MSTIDTTQPVTFGGRASALGRAAAQAPACTLRQSTGLQGITMPAGSPAAHPLGSTTRIRIGNKNFDQAQAVATDGTLGLRTRRRSPV